MAVFSQQMLNAAQPGFQTRLAWAGHRGRDILARLEALPSPDTAAALRWLYASSPLSDWVNYGFELFHACASHGVLSGPAIDRINASPIQELALLNTIPAIKPGLSQKIKYLSVAPMFCEAIERIYQEVSISKLFR